jgi:molybdate transport system permease protein
MSGMSAPRPAETSETTSSTEHHGDLGQSRTPRAIALSDTAFFAVLGIIGGVYVLLILSLLAADAAYMVRQTLRAAADTPHPWLAALTENPILTALGDRKIQYSIWLSMISCTLSAILSVVVAVPLGYLMARHRFFGQRLLDAVLDIPIVLPPLVVGLSLLILFQFPPFSWLAREIVYQVPAVILAQFSVACAFAVRTMKHTFDHIDPRCENVALSLGCSRVQAFGWVVLPEAARGMMTALTLAWARSLGEFGPLLVFAGATRMKTEVLSTSVFLELNVGHLEAAVAVSLIMVVSAVIVLIIARLWGSKDLGL